MALTSTGVLKQMQKVLDDLIIPQEYARHDLLTQDSDELFQKLDNWKTNSVLRLRELTSYLSSGSELALDEQSSLVLHVSAYDGDNPWVSSLTRAEAQSASKKNPQRSRLFLAIEPFFFPRDIVDFPHTDGAIVARSPSQSDQARLPVAYTPECESWYWEETGESCWWTVGVAGYVCVSGLEGGVSGRWECGFVGGKTYQGTCLVFVEECVKREACMYRVKITRGCGIWLFHRQ